jgi:hypothetical protein
VDFHELFLHSVEPLVMFTGVAPTLQAIDRVPHATAAEHPRVARRLRGLHMATIAGAIPNNPLFLVATRMTMSSIAPSRRSNRFRRIAIASLGHSVVRTPCSAPKTSRSAPSSLCSVGLRAPTNRALGHSLRSLVCSHRLYFRTKRTMLDSADRHDSSG